MKNRMKNSMLLLALMAGVVEDLAAATTNNNFLTATIYKYNNYGRQVSLINYLYTCSQITYDPSTEIFSCNCQNASRSSTGLASYDVSKCYPGSIQNINGQIGCNVIGSNCKRMYGQPCCLLPKLSQTQISAAAAAA